MNFIKKIVYILVLMILFSCSKKFEIEYYSDGSIKSKSRIDSKGEKNGLSEVFYESGNIKARLFYLDDKLNDTCKWFFDNGNIKLIKTYKDGLENGLAKEYDAQNKLVKISDYKEGDIVYAKELFNEANSKEYRRFFAISYFDTITLRESYKIEFGLINSNLTPFDSILFLCKKPKIIVDQEVVLQRQFEQVTSDNDTAKVIFTPSKEGKYGFVVAILELSRENGAILYEYKMDFVVGKSASLKKPTEIEGLINGKELVNE